MKKLLSSIAIAALLSGSAEAATLNVTPGTGASLGQGVDGSGNLLGAMVICGALSTVTLYAVCVNQVTVAANGGMNVNILSGTVALTSNTSLTPVFVVPGTGSPFPVTLFGLNAITVTGFIPTVGSLPIAVSSSNTVTTILLQASGGSTDNAYLTSWSVQAASGTFELVEGTTTTNPCDTGQTALSGAYIMNGQQFGETMGGAATAQTHTLGDNICALITASTAYVGNVTGNSF